MGDIVKSIYWAEFTSIEVTFAKYEFFIIIDDIIERLSDLKGENSLQFFAYV
jgi:hypothetical protein